MAFILYHNDGYLIMKPQICALSLVDAVS